MSMEMNTKIKKYILILFIGILLLLGVYIAYATYQYEILVRGIMGVIFIFLLYFYIGNSGIDVSIDEVLVTSKRIKFFILIFLGTLVATWAVKQTIDMIWFLFKLF